MQVTGIPEDAIVFKSLWLDNMILWTGGLKGLGELQQQ